MKRKFKVIWGILTGNLITGYLSVGILPSGRFDIILSTYKAKEGGKADYTKSVILPPNTIVFVPKLTEGRIETPDEWLLRTKGGVEDGNRKRPPNGFIEKEY